jgi:hypothetical protein
MPVTQTKPAGQAVQISTGAEMVLNNAERARKIAAARAAADTLTPLDAPLFDETPAPAQPQTSQRPITMQIAAVLNGFTVTISFEGHMTQLPGAIERLRALGATPTQGALAAPLATPDDLPDGYKLCRKHGAPMRPRNKQNEHWHSHNVGTADAPLWCKGYRGSDSPGYEVD